MLCFSQIFNRTYSIKHIRGRRGRGRAGATSARGMAGGLTVRERGGVTTRGRGARGRGRGGRTSVAQSDRERVQERFMQRSEKLETIVRRMAAMKLRDLVLKLVKREPGIVEAGWAPPSQPPSPLPSQVPSWCRCRKCEEMPTELEMKCCGCKPENCVGQKDIRYHFTQYN